jgi:putative FmdB family regulatory protein
MPIYEYECSSCQTRFERSQRFSDPPVTECPECGGAVRRVLFPAGIVFKGSGWYITDSRSTPSSETSASSPTSSNGTAGAEAKSDGARSDSTKGEGAARADSSTAKSDATGKSGASGATKNP